jgi:hypothetical protein
LALSNASKMIFQNHDNLQVFIENKIITENKAVRVGKPHEISCYVRAAIIS